MKMGFNKISEEIAPKSSTASNNQSENSIKKRIYTCDELEGRKMRLSKLNLISGFFSRTMEDFFGIASDPSMSC